MKTKSQREETREAAASRLAARWSGRDPFELANRATAQLMDSASDWSPPPGVEFEVPTLQGCVSSQSGVPNNAFMCGSSGSSSRRDEPFSPD